MQGENNLINFSTPVLPLYSQGNIVEIQNSNQSSNFIDSNEQSVENYSNFSEESDLIFLK